MNPEAPEAITDNELTDFKLELCEHLADEATAILLDPQYSAAQAVSTGLIPSGTGIVVAVEATGYSGKPSSRLSHVLQGWSAAKVKRMGADMAKLLVYYHPGAKSAGEIEVFVSKIAAQCIEADLALMLEPLTYSLNSDLRPLPSMERREVILEIIHRLVVPGVDLLKIEFPVNISEEQEESVWYSACSEVTELTTVPWILLSAAVDYETYLRQVDVACRAGASGVAVGRAIWKEAIGLSREQRRKFLASTAQHRLSRLNALSNSFAKPWNDYYHVGQIPGEWYREY